MSESYNNESLFDFVDNHDKSVNNVPADEVAATPVDLLPAKLPLAGTFLFIRPGLNRNGFWVKFTRIETWCHTQSGVRQWVYVGERARRRRFTHEDGTKGEVFIFPKQNETWTFTADTIVRPKLYTAVRHDRLLRAYTAIKPLGAQVSLKTFAERAKYGHVLGGYSAAKSLYPDIGIIRDESGIGITTPF